MPKIGPYSLYSIEAGRFGLDGGAMFGIVPKPLWERRIKPDDRNRIPLHMRCLLLEGDGRLILVDDGAGDKYDAKFQDIYAIDQEHSELHRSLDEAGFSALDVTDVILTHLHFDHCGGSTRRNGDRLELTFPGATYHVQRAHWDWACHPNLRERASFLAENLEPLGASGQLNLVDGDGELFPGIEVITVNGHTEAQQLVK
ncbi:MAG: MBL fold metallo-hydrolase, partial [Rhodothermales bacterium]